MPAKKQKPPSVADKKNLHRKPKRLNGINPPPPPSTPIIPPIKSIKSDLGSDPPHRLWRNIRRPLPRDIKRSDQRIAIPEHFKPHPRAEPAPGNTKPGIPSNEHSLPTVILTRKNRTPRTVINRPTPRMRELHIIQLRERPIKSLSEFVISPLIAILRRIVIATKVITNAPAKNDPI